MSDEESSLRDATRNLLRTRVLDAATDLASCSGWKSVRMEDIAAGAGVSRRTVFREFGSKSGVLREIAWRGNRELLEGSRRCLDAHVDDPVAAVTAVAHYLLVTAAEHPMLKLLLTGEAEQADELLSLVTTGSGPFIDASTEFGVAFVREHWSDRFTGVVDVRFAMDAVVRLLLSHVVQPAGDPATVAESIGALFAFLSTASAAPRNHPSSPDQNGPT